jgi:hypothetical protein
VTNEPDPLRDAPDEVFTFFREAVGLRDHGLRIYPLTVDESRTYSAAIQKSDVGTALGLVALDNANDSNPYCLICRGVARGMVVHFSHDPEPEIRFADLASFKAALIAAREQRQSIDELPAELLRPHPDQESLAKTLVDLNREESDTAEFLLCLYVPLLSPDQVTILDQLGSNASFFVRESIARYVQVHPRSEYLAIAARLAADTHPQVANLAKKALSSVNRVIYSKP